MSEAHDPLDGLFASDEVENAGDDTQSGTDTQTATTGDDTKTSQEAPGADSVDGGNADDKIDATGTVKMVPLAALDEARKRAKDAEDRLAARGAGTDTQTSTDAGEFVQIDPKEDPAGAYEQMMGIVQLNAVNTTLNFSEKAARKEHGAELVDKVMAWASGRFEKEPEYAARVLADADPYELAIADYKKMERDTKINKIDPAILEGLDEDEAEMIRAHRASKAPKEGEDTGGSTTDQNAQPRGEGGRFAETPPRRKVDAPPRSIADAPSGGGKTSQQTVAAGDGVAFDDAFK